MWMDWSRAVNSYCERLDASFWSEPVNALSNVGFLLVAALVWRRPEVRSDPGARLLTLVLVAIGVGSFLFHTHAEVWAMLADVLPILGFILIYVHLATVRFLGAPVWGGALAAVAYVPASAMASRGITSAVGPVNGSVSYMPVAILIAAYALALARRKPQTARGLAIGAAALYAASNIMMRKTPQVSSTVGALMMCLTGAILATIGALVLEGPPPIPPFWPLVVTIVLGVFSSGLGTVGWVWLIQRRGAVFTSMTVYLLPLWATVIGVGLMHERPGWSAFAALALILGGVGLTTVRPKAAAQAA